jgi:hypothetical protein
VDKYKVSDAKLRLVWAGLRNAAHGFNAECRREYEVHVPYSCVEQGVPWADACGDHV